MKEPNFRHLVIKSGFLYNASFSHASGGFIRGATKKESVHTPLRLFMGKINALQSNKKIFFVGDFNST